MVLFSKVLNLTTDKHQSLPKVSPTSSSRSSTCNISPVCSRSSTSSSITPTKSTISQAFKIKKPSLLPSSNTPSPKADYSVIIKLESPPIILYGTPTESTGSILSGLLRLVTVSNVKIETVTLSLVQTIKYTKPFVLPNSSTVANCRDCVFKTEVLARWDVLTTPTDFPSGNHAYPFSHLLPGSLPPTSKLGSSHSQSFIKYDLIAEVVTTNPANSKKLVLPINVSRSTLRGPDRNSLRIFPPTEVTATAVLPNVIYPKSTFPIELRLDNMASPCLLRRWRMKKLSWRIEESVKVKAYVCNSHIKKLKTLEEALQKNPPKKEKSSGMHHSTIQTNISLLSNSSTQLLSSSSSASSSAAAAAAAAATTTQGSSLLSENGLHDSEPVDDEDAGLHDYEETIHNGPLQAHRTFIEDFGGTTAGASESVGSEAVTPQVSVASQQRQTEDLTKHIFLEETRTVSYGDIKSGWKSDFSGSGKIEIVANISAHKFSTGSNNHIVEASTSDHLKLNASDFKTGANVSCDIDDPNLGVFVNHTLVIEIVVAEEVVHQVDARQKMAMNGLRPARSNTRGGHISRRSSSSGSAYARTNNNNNNNNDTTTTTVTSSSAAASIADADSPRLTPVTSQSSQSQHIQMGVPTGAARVLRMQFKLPVTERSGLGIAWDDEVPPTYEDIRALSPPHYQDQNSSTDLPTPPTTACTSTDRHTPNIFYGRGDTPLAGSFSPMSPHGVSLDELVDNIQELSI
ncbi:LDB19 [Candida oxycetoniae]|uniref:LDB19 n=1 Tax=Candida oxycetoniae TaxID=497107 RepID=A0AAI9T1C5_9ASCO|nr:LDB19 [Candida oxycetoniae]KAI3406822.2 LDB19 [Candida oxycetoniae]